MNCKSVQNRLSAYLDRELGGDELLQIRAHVSTCRECRAEYEGLRSLKLLLGGVQCPEPPEDLAQRLSANMLRQRVQTPRRFIRESAMMFAGVAACSMLLTIAIHQFGQMRTSGVKAPTSVSKESANYDWPGNGDLDTVSARVPIISAANYGPR